MEKIHNNNNDDGSNKYNVDVIFLWIELWKNINRRVEEACL